MAFTQPSGYHPGKECFEWDEAKDCQNWTKHGVRFAEAQFAFADPRRVILEDLEHSDEESRYYCLGQIERGILTVRFTYRTCCSNHWRRVLAQRQKNL